MNLYDQLNSLFISVGWSKRPDKILEDMLSLSRYIQEFNDSEGLIGFGRLVGLFHPDSERKAYHIYDLVVHPFYQGKGLGKKIVSNLTEDIFEEVYVEVKDPKVVGFYERLGFKRLHEGFIEGIILMKKEKKK